MTTGDSELHDLIDCFDWLDSHAHLITIRWNDGEWSLAVADDADYRAGSLVAAVTAAAKRER